MEKENEAFCGPATSRVNAYIRPSLDAFFTFRHVLVDRPLHLGEAPLEIIAAASAAGRPC